jgi:hypothetical protein
VAAAGAHSRPCGSDFSLCPGVRPQVATVRPVLLTLNEKIATAHRRRDRARPPKSRPATPQATASTALASPADGEKHLFVGARGACNAHAPALSARGRHAGLIGPTMAAREQKSTASTHARRVAVRIQQGCRRVHPRARHYLLVKAPRCLAADGLARAGMAAAAQGIDRGRGVKRAMVRLAGVSRSLRRDASAARCGIWPPWRAGAGVAGPSLRGRFAANVQVRFPHGIAPATIGFAPAPGFVPLGVGSGAARQQRRGDTVYHADGPRSPPVL